MRDHNRVYVWLRVNGSGFRVKGLGLRVEGLGPVVEGLGFRIQGLGFRVEGPQYFDGRAAAQVPLHPEPQTLNLKSRFGISMRVGGNLHRTNLHRTTIDYKKTPTP